MTLRRNIYYSITSQWVGAALAAVTTIFVSRLLTPREVGIFAVSMAVVGLVATLQNFGTQEFIVHRMGLDTGTRRSAFFVSIVMGLATSVLLVAVSGPVAQFYDAPELQLVMWILAANPILNVLAAPITSMLARERMFLKLGMITVISAAANTVTAVGLAFAGFSYLSLAFGLLAGSLTALVTRFVIGTEFALWRPSIAGARAVFSFGLKVHLAQVFTQIQASTTELIIGKLLGLSAAAIFHRAGFFGQMFSKLVARSFSPILLTEYAALNRAGQSIVPSFLGSMRYLSGFGWPFFAFMALYANEAIHILFGHQWTAAVVPSQLLCMGAVFWPMNGPSINALIGTGAVNLNLFIRSVTVALRVLLTIIASVHSLEAVASAVVVSAAVTFVLSNLAVRRIASFSFRDFAASLTPSVAVTVTAVVPAFFVKWLFHDTLAPDFVVLSLGLFAAGLGWLAGLWLTGHPLAHEVGLFVRRAGDVLIPANRDRATLR